MPKSKVKKQQEAVERLRLLHSKKLETYLKSLPGGSNYKFNATFGVDYADKRAQEETKAYEKKFCAEAHLDRYGNPI